MKMTEHMMTTADELQSFRALLSASAAGWSSRPHDHRQAWTETIILRTVREILAEISGLPTETAAKCRAAQTIEDASRAALAAEGSFWDIGSEEEAIRAARDSWQAAEMLMEAAAVTRAMTPKERAIPCWSAEEAVTKITNAAAFAVAVAARTSSEAAEAVLQRASKIWRMT